jgi:cholesterol oxidase
MSELIETKIHPEDLPAITLRLRHLVTDNVEKPALPLKAVLLLHGASANHGTFTTPCGEAFTTPIGGLAGWLADSPHRGTRYDVWLLDWRGSSLVIDDPCNQGTLSPGRGYNFNAAARFDIRAAIDEMVNQRVTPPIAAIGHCMGSGILAEAIALGYVTDRDVDCIVLSTLGLFYETAIDSRMKSEDRVLERLARARSVAHPILSVDPRIADANGTVTSPWPPDLENLFKNWPGGQFHIDNAADSLNAERTMANLMCDRLSFMYGMVFNHTNLAEEIHASDRPTLKEKFGAIPLRMYVHAARNIRQGRATVSKDSQPTDVCDADFTSEAAHSRFRRLSRVTLITGGLNRLWHRESVDLMYEWLCRGSSDFVRKVKKRIFPTYGHQDLLWGQKAPAKVFPAIAEGLTVQAPAVAASVSRH